MCPIAGESWVGARENLRDDRESEPQTSPESSWGRRRIPVTFRSGGC